MTTKRKGNVLMANREEKTLAARVRSPREAYEELKNNWKQLGIMLVGVVSSGCNASYTAQIQQRRGAEWNSSSLSACFPAFLSFILFPLPLSLLLCCCALLLSVLLRHAAAKAIVYAAAREAVPEDATTNQSVLTLHHRFSWSYLYRAYIVNAHVLVDLTG
jgi:hypothetical protein